MVLANIVDRKNVWMVERRGGARFLSEARQPIRIGGERCGKNLDGDVAVKACIAGAVDLAHASRT